MKNSLKTKSLILVFIILSAVLAINTAFLSLSFVSFQKNSLQNQVRMVGEHLRDEMSRAVNLGLNLESLEGLNESCHEIVENNKEIGYCMLVNTESRVFSKRSSFAGRFLCADSGKRGGGNAASLYKTGMTKTSSTTTSRSRSSTLNKASGLFKAGAKYTVPRRHILLWESVRSA
jgi:hypothetical protein